MAKSVQTGIDKILKYHETKQKEQTDLSWRDIRNKIDSLLLRTNVLKTDEARKACQALDTMNSDERIKYITEKWGIHYVQRVDPLLHQLKVLEERIEKSKN